MQTQRLTTIQLSKEYHEFSAGHFTMFSATHRERMHGHNFTVNAAIDVVVQDHGIAFDYAIYKDKLSKLCKQLNGYFLLPSKSPYLMIEEQEDYYVGHFNNEKIPLPKADVILLPLRNISVEELAIWFLDQLVSEAAEIEHYQIQGITIQVYSSPGQSASAVWEKNKGD